MYTLVPTCSHHLTFFFLYIFVRWLARICQSTNLEICSMSHSSVIAALFIVMSLSRVALLLPGVLQCSPKCHSARSGIRTLCFSSMHNWLIRCADAPTRVAICACAVVVSGISEQRKSLQRFVHHGTLNTAHVC